jgi:hypothetical protein
MIMDNEYISLVLGLISICIATASGIFYYYLDYRRRRKEEEFFSKEIKENIQQIIQFFNNVHSISTRDMGFESVEEEVTNSLNNFYVKKSQEMKDILYLTKLYLPQWKSLNSDNKKTVKNILEHFSWLLYEYHPLHLPIEVRRIRWQNHEKTLDNKKNDVVEFAETLLET